MNGNAMDCGEFLEGRENEEEEYLDEELEVQKVVVEKLAADKVELSEKISGLESELKAKNAEVYSLKSSLEELKTKAAALESALAAQREKEIDLQERKPNALALLDRDIDLPDRFPGETRDHVIEAVRKCRDEAEAEGRTRKAQVLEGVLLCNEPNGTLERKREELKRLFEENGNIVNGPVMEELKRLDIPFRKGEEYLLPSEIMARTY